MSRRIARRDFVKSAVAIGGASALSACLGREDVDLPEGDPGARPERQHAWNAALATDEHGNHRSPHHHVVRLLDYRGDGPPADADRDTVAEALQALERAYPPSHESEDGTAAGLLFTVGYSPSYFDRFGATPETVDLPTPEPLAPFEEPTPDDPDVVLHLASDYGSVVLAAEEALLGELGGGGGDGDIDGREAVNGVDVPGLATVFANADLAGSGRTRRTGFVGAGLPADNQDVAGIPDSEPVDEEAPLYMGFKSGFAGNQAGEDRVTIESGPFAGGTTQHLSLIRLRLQQWYEQDSRYHREATMFCPAHAEEDRIEGAGHNLGTDSGMDEACEHATEHAQEYGKVGHSQKMTGVREDDEPLILRRDFDSTDDDRATLHFLSLQGSIADFVETREAMNGSDVADETAVGQRTNNGILQYMDVERRGNYLLPPRAHRALPAPDP
jgi:hypothetical protein